VIRALREPRWLAGLAVAVVFAVVCVLLAQWQLDRRVARAERNAAVLENFDSEPAPLDGALAEAGTDLDAAWPGDQEWRPVRLQGRYDAEGTVLVRNRPQGGVNGYLVAVPFTLEQPVAVDGGDVATLLLVRGWVPSGESARAPDMVPVPPEGTVEVVARLRAGEGPATRSAPEGQTYRLHVPALLTDPGALTGAYGVVASEAGERPADAVLVPRPDTDPGPHLSYGVQWYLFALAGLGIWVVLARRHGAADRDGSTDGSAGGSTGTGGPGGTGTSTPGASAGWVYEPGR
jgi:cytochrome oxidase assembly protein ShyY1